VLDPNRKAKAWSQLQLGGLASLGNLAKLRRRGVEFELPLPGEERLGIYHFAREYAMIESGMRTEWVTATQ